MIRVAINQSNYIPWKGYFDLLHDVDVFIFYDDVQYTKHDWRNRNRLKGQHGSQWITIPVGEDLNRRIDEVRITDPRWQVKHWKRLSQTYGRTPGFGRIRAFLEELYLHSRWESLSRVNQHIIKTIARDFLGIRTELLQSSDFSRTGAKQDAVLSLLKTVGADVYVSGPAGQAYLQPHEFEKAGIGLVWKDYSGYPEYPQIHPPFDHYVSILDLLCHTGSDAQHYIWGWREAGKTARPATNAEVR